MDFTNLISRLNAIGSLQGSVTEAEEKCPKCGCTPCECDDKDKVDEAKKPDADKDGIPDWADKKPGADDNEENEVKESALDLLRRHAGIQEAAPVNFDKVLDAIAALYGDDMWNNDSMQDLAHDLEQQNPTEQELDSIIATGELPQRLANTQFTNNDSVKFDEALNVRKLGDTMGVDVQQLRMAVSRASAGRQTRNDVMLLSDTFVKLLNNPDDTVIQTVANLIKSGNTAPAPDNNMANMKQEGNEFSGALKAAKEAGAEEFEVGGKKYKVNEDCGDVEMSPLSSMGQMSSSPEQEHNERYTLTITRGDKNLNVTTDNPDELLSIMKLAGISGSTEVVQQAPEQEVEESGYENTPTQTNEREPKAYGDIRDWGMKGTGRGQPGSALNKPSGQGDNPLGEQAMMESYKKFKAGK